MNNNVAPFSTRKIENKELSGYKNGEPPDGGNGMKQRVTRLEGKFELLECKIDNLTHNIDKQFEQVDKRFEQVDKRFEQIPDQIMNKMKVWLLSIFIPMALTLAISLFTLAISFYKLF